MESTLRPRDIQARIRAGETPEAVAQAAQTRSTRSWRSPRPCSPSASTSPSAPSARRYAAATRQAAGGARTLGDAVAAHLRALNVDPADRRVGRLAPRGRPLVADRGATPTGARSGTAEFTFDVPGNYVTLENDDARWLVGEAIAADAAPRPGRRPAQAARERRLSSVAPTTTLDDAGAAAGRRRHRPGHRRSRSRRSSTPSRRPTTRSRPQEAELPRGGRRDAAAERARADEPSPSRPAAPVKKTRGRASVPSWDEIMFGGGEQG